MPQRAVLVESVVVLLFASVAGWPASDGTTQVTKSDNVPYRTATIELYTKAVPEIQNNSIDSSTDTSQTPKPKTKQDKIVSNIKWIPRDVTLAPPKETSEVYMGAIIAVPTLSCPQGYRRQAGRCRKVYY